MKFSTVEIMEMELAIRKESDSGRYGDAYELAVRYYLTGRRWARVKRQGAPDITKVVDGKRVRIEIKTACGELDDTYTAPFIIYCPEVDANFPAEEQGYVFSNAEWIAFLNGYNGRGKFIRTYPNGTDHINPFRTASRPKASKPIAEYIESVLFDMPTVSEFFSE